MTAGASGRVPPLALPSRLGSSPTPAREPGCWALDSARIPDAYEHLRADGRKSQEYLLTDHGDWQAGVHEWQAGVHELVSEGRHATYAHAASSAVPLLGCP